ncbi:MAG: lipase family protein [Spirochaetales bacterium]|nr:lipase family protein [Spirochaetales bacterium]
MILLISRFFLISSILLIFSCQSFPQGNSISDLEKFDKEGFSTGFSTVDLYRYFTLCRVVWREREEWRKTTWDLDYFYNENTNTLGLSVLEDGVLNISFRSSEALEKGVDLKYNARIGLKKVPFLEESGIRIFSGFLDKYMSVREELHNRIETSGTDRIVLVGHSGGGAIASIAYLDLVTLYPDKNIKAVLFGPVRTFNKAGAVWFSYHGNRVIRIVNGRDPFSNLPPALFGYRHVGQLVRIGRRPWYKLFSFKDHNPGYRLVLEDILEEDGFIPAQFAYY